jgi:hypothetical protein
MRMMRCTGKKRQASNVLVLPQELVCSNEFGVWSRIDSDNKIVEALTSYYQLFNV